MNLRRLSAADAAALRALRLEAFTLHPREFRSTPEDEAATPLADLAAALERDHVLGLFEGGELIGSAGVSIEPRPKLAHKATIRGVFVRPAWRGRGGAERLLRALIGAVEGRVETIDLVVSDGAAPALRLYTRLGFAPSAFERRALKLADGTYVDETTMVRNMSGRPTAGDQSAGDQSDAESP